MAKRKVIAGLKLPTKKTIPATNLGAYSILLYGEKKIGKTTLAAQFEDALFFAFEPGLKALAVFKMVPSDWATFKKQVRLLEKGKHQFKTVVIDTADKMYDQCFEYCCIKHGFEHPSDKNDFGKSWGIIKKEFAKVIDRLLNLGIGVIFISHASDKEIKSRHGGKFHKMQCTMSGQANDVIGGLVDVWCHYGYAKSKRILTLEGDEYIDAGNRTDGRFIFKSTTEAIATLPMGNSAAEGFSNFVRAFNNQFAKPVKKKKKALKKG